MAPQVLIALMEEGTPVDMQAWVSVAEGAAELHAARVTSEVVVVKSLRQREELVGRLKSAPPAILFLPVEREQIHPANALLLALRGAGLPMVTAVGGPMGTLGADIFTFNPASSAVILGEWQPILARFARAFLRHASAADTRGVWWRGRQGWHLTPATPPVEQLDDLALPDYSALPIRDLLKANGRALPFAASRGCPFSCSFCHVPMLRKLEHPDANYRARSPEAIVSHIAAAVAEFDVRRVAFVDELFPWQDEWVGKFCRLWRQQVRLPFSWTSAAEQVSREKLRQLAEAGGDCMNLGIETGDEKRRAVLADRNVSNHRLQKVVELARELNVRVAASMMLGLPQTSREEIVQSVEFLRQLRPDEIAHRFYEPWPRKSNWSETQHEGLELTGVSIRGGAASATAPRATVKDARELKWAVEQFRKLDCEARIARIPGVDGEVFNGLRSLSQARIRSPLANPLRVDEFHAANGSHPVLALRVPTEVSWEVELFEGAHLDFGMILEPTLPGLRTRTPIVFNIKLEQGGQSYRLFQKVLIQALDPDSRRWHLFSLPLRPASPGLARISIDNLIFGRDASAMPLEGDVWAGWSGMVIRRPEAPGTAAVE